MNNRDYFPRKIRINHLPVKCLKSKNYSDVETSKMDFKDTPAKIAKQFLSFPFLVNPDSAYLAIARSFSAGL